MSEQFSVGEIAILSRCMTTPEWEGREVEITAPLENNVLRYHWKTGRIVPCEPCYGVSAPWFPNFEEWSCPARYLRKRPQPPDWEKLATPTDVPDYALT